MVCYPWPCVYLGTSRTSPSQKLEMHRENVSHHVPMLNRRQDTAHPRAHNLLSGVSSESVRIAQVLRYDMWVFGESLSTYTVLSDTVTGYFRRHRKPLDDGAGHGLACYGVELERETCSVWSSCWVAMFRGLEMQAGVYPLRF